MLNVGNQNGLIVVPGIANQNPNGNGNCIVQLSEKYVAYLQSQLLIAQKEEAGIQLQEQKNLIDVASTSGTQSDKAPVYDSGARSLEQDEGIVEQHLATIEETRAYFESLHNNLAIEVEKVNSVNRKIKETNVDLTTDLARYKNQEKCFEISQEKYDKLERHDPPVVYDLEETLQLAQESRLKMKQSNKEIKPENYTKINHLSGVFVSQMAKSREESYFTNTSKTVTVSKSISIPNEEFSDDATPSVARKILNEDMWNWKLIVLLRLSWRQDIMAIVQNSSVVDSSNLQIELERTKERFENCIIKKENEYAKLWNDCYKTCEECKYDKILYDKAYNDMQQKIERLQAQLGDQKGKSKDTPYVSNTLDPLSQELENPNVELEF
ncbi:hypothetical protein Tco_0256371 [Tanacetum coccineum]